MPTVCRTMFALPSDRIPGVRPSVLIIMSLLLFGAVGCRTVIIPNTATFVAPPTVRSSETSMTFSSGGRGPPGTGFLAPSTIVQFNDFSKPSYFGWSWTSDGINWNYCNAVIPGCGGTGVPVPLAAGQANWRGDPGIAAASDQSGIVVATQLANSVGDSGDPNMIVASLSFDGGRTFTSTVHVNDAGCSNGDQDQQAVAADPTTQPTTFWFVWRHNGAAWTGGGTYGACVRGGTVNPVTRAIDWLGPSEDVENLDRTPFWGVGGLLVQAGRGALTVAYSNTDHIFDDCSAGKEVRWFTVTSTNNGVDWTPSHEVYDTQIFGWCAASDRLLNTLRAFGFVRDATGAYWMAVHDSPGTVKVFVSTDTGATWLESVTLRTGNDLLFPTVATDFEMRDSVSVIGATADGTELIQRFASTGRDVNGPPVDRRWWGLQSVSSSASVPAGMASRGAGDFNGATGVLQIASPSSNETFAVAFTTMQPIPRVTVVFIRVTE